MLRLASVLRALPFWQRQANSNARTAELSPEPWAKGFILRDWQKMNRKPLSPEGRALAEALIKGLDETAASLPPRPRFPRGKPLRDPETGAQR